MRKRNPVRKEEINIKSGGKWSKGKLIRRKRPKIVISRVETLSPV